MDWKEFFCCLVIVLLVDSFFIIVFIAGTKKDDQIKESEQISTNLLIENERLKVLLESKE